eukprot:1699391-Prymnesium_polylepis.1
MIDRRRRRRSPGCPCALGACVRIVISSSSSTIDAYEAVLDRCAAPRCLWHEIRVDERTNR